MGTPPDAVSDTDEPPGEPEPDDPARAQPATPEAAPERNPGAGAAAETAPQPPRYEPL